MGFVDTRLRIETRSMSGPRGSSFSQFVYLNAAPSDQPEGVCLVDGKGRTAQEYLALSHSRGDMPSNSEDFDETWTPRLLLQRFHVTTQPILYRDTIEVTRGLKKRYPPPKQLFQPSHSMVRCYSFQVPMNRFALWSLRTIWKTGLENGWKMSEIYSASHVTISVTSCQNRDP
jgi:hypothetical protein